MGAFVPDGPLVLGIDETLERRRGRRSLPRGSTASLGALQPLPLGQEQCPQVGLPDAIGRGPVGESGLVDAVPFVVGLLRTLRREQGKRHKTLTEWAWQLLLLVRRWWPEREIVAVADSTYASLRLLERCRSLSNPIAFITRLRLDAALYEPAPPRRPGQMGRPRLKGSRLPNLSVVAEDPASEWTPMKLAHWYGEGERAVEVVSPDGRLVLNGVARRACALGANPRSARRVQDPGSALHRSRGEARTDHLVVRKALADGSHLPRSASAPGV